VVESQSHSEQTSSVLQPEKKGGGVGGVPPPVMTKKEFDTTRKPENTGGKGGFLRIQNFEYCTKPRVGPIQKCSSKCREGGGCCECEVESCHASCCCANSLGNSQERE
jgi:hypothetical protein